VTGDPIARIERHVRVLKWMVATNIALQLLILGLLCRASALTP